MRARAPTEYEDSDLKRLFKFLHEVGTVGMMGAVAAQLVMAVNAEGLPDLEYAAIRQSILLVSQWLLLPSLGLVLLSGLWAMAAHRPYHSADWAWIKLGMTVLVLEGTLIAVQGPARQAAELSARIAAGEPQLVTQLQQVLRHEQGGALVVLLLATANIVLAVWRPRFRVPASKPG